jgi:putative membrane protein
MRAKRSLVLLVVAVLLLVLALTIVPRVKAAESPLNAHEQSFVAKATADDGLQIAMAKVALARSMNAKVHAFARRLIADHQALNLQFAHLSVRQGSRGHSHGMPVRDIADMNMHLRSLSGPAFDQAFVGMMVNEHRKIIPAYEDAARTSPHASLRKIARHGLPVLRGHLAAAESLLDGMAAKPGGKAH